MKVRLMAGIFASLLALLGLGGCKGGETEHPTDAPTSHVDDGAELPEILDGPGMYFDPKAEYLDKLWTDPASGQTLFFTTDTLTLKDFRAVSPLFDEDVYTALALHTCVNGRKVYGGPARESVEKQISLIEEFIGVRK